jgi:alkylation response protein AidB-like acyl-CoA dehydrogenase
VSGRGVALAAGLDLSPEQADMLATVREFVERSVIPVANDLEHRDEFPEAIVEQMRQMGLFGVTIDPEYGGLGEGLTTYALMAAELSRGWMSLSGVLNTHFIVSYLISRHGTGEQKRRLLPPMATGELRAALSMSEPGAGSDVAAISCRAARDGDSFVVDGQKMWVTNGLRAGLVALLVKTDLFADPPQRGMSILLVEKPAGQRHHGGLSVGANIGKLGYRGVETTDLSFDAHRVPAAALLGGSEGQGFPQVMDGIEVGRVNVAARAVGVAARAFEEAIRYAQVRQTFGKPIARHQAIGFSLAEMATKIEAARLMMLSAARAKDSGRRADLEAGMAKLFASEVCQEVALAALRLHGGYGYSTEATLERLYRDAPFLLIGEGTSEIQKLVIARQLLKHYAVGP